MTEYAQLILDGKTYNLPIHRPTLGNPTIDISTLGDKTGYFTFDPGFKSTASCDSSITYIDGNKGVLLYRGYRIQDLAEKSSFLETSYLLLHEKLPSEKEYALFNDQIKHHSLINEQLIEFFNGFRRDAHPMAIMCGVVGALSSFYHDALDIRNPEDRDLAAIRLLAKIPTLAAMSYKYSIGQAFIHPQNHFSYIENFINMMFSTKAEPLVITPTQVNALEKIFILHADHEQNASTSTVRMAGSSGANPFACMAAGITALWGPAHGGANEAVLKMLNQIGTPEGIEPFLAKVKDKNEHTRLMGFGHRVYKNFDPRAKIIREVCHDLLKEMGRENDPLFQVALQLEDIALKDPYFIERKLYPNVDFYSGIILQAIGIPTNMFTVIFAVSRTIGWISQWKEMVSSSKMVIARPRQLYTGSPERDYVEIKSR